MRGLSSHSFLFVSDLSVTGSRSHETTPSLPPPTPPSFPPDFAQVLQATTASPARGRWRIALAGTGVVRDTVVGMREDHGFASGVRSPTRRQPEQIAEEEGWQVVEDEGDGLE